MSKGKKRKGKRKKKEKSPQLWLLKGKSESHLGWIFRVRICQQFAQYRLSADGLLGPENLACNIHIGKAAKLENNLGNLSCLVESKKKKKKMLCAGKGLASHSLALGIPINQGQWAF